MISPSAKGVVIIAEMLRRNGYKLEPISNVPLTRLVSDSLGIARVSQEHTTAHVDFVTKAHEIIANSGAIAEGIQSVGEHELNMTKAAEALAAIIRPNLQIVRGTIRPLIESTVNAVSTSLAGLANIAVTTPIVESHLHPIFSEPMVQELLKPRVSVYADLPGTAFYEVLDTPQITALVSTGMQRVDTQLEDLMNSVGSERLLNIYAEFFAGNVNEYPSVSGEIRRDDLCLAFFMARGLVAKGGNYLLSNKQSETTVHHILETFMDQCSLRIQSSVNLFHEAIDAGQLVISYPRELTSDKNVVSEPILVNGIVYQDWIAEQGSPEILYGAMLTDQLTAAVPLMQGREKYIQACNAYLNKIEQINESNREAVIRSVMVDATIAYVQGMETINGYKGNRDTLPDEMRSYAARTYIRNPDDVYEVVKSMVCKLMFADTHVEEIIDAMTKYEGESQDCTAEECLANVVMDLIVRGVTCGQTVVKQMGAQ